MQFWRVCHRDQTAEDDYGTPYYVGPYTGDIDGLPWESEDQLADMMWAHNDDSHPSICTDIGPGFESYLCGFTTLQDMRYWFDGWWGILEECGFVVRWWPDVDPSCVRQGISQAGCLITELDMLPCRVFEDLSLVNAGQGVLD